MSGRQCFYNFSRKICSRCFNGPFNSQERQTTSCSMLIDVMIISHMTGMQLGSHSLEDLTASYDIQS